MKDPSGRVPRCQLHQLDVVDKETVACKDEQQPCISGAPLTLLGMGTGTAVKVVLEVAA